MRELPESSPRDPDRLLPLVAEVVRDGEILCFALHRFTVVWCTHVFRRCLCTCDIWDFCVHVLSGVSIYICSWVLLVHVLSGMILCMRCLGFLCMCAVCGICCMCSLWCLCTPVLFGDSVHVFPGVSVYMCKVQSFQQAECQVSSVQSSQLSQSSQELNEPSQANNNSSTSFARHTVPDPC